MYSNLSFKLSGQGRIASAVSMALVLPIFSVSAFAANITPKGDTSVSQVGQVDVVNIANPNAQGLSHNQYYKYNVSESGAVLNNSLASGRSQLAGQLDANSNLTNSASIILNEVVSKNPSLLLGQQEVFGMAADYVLANPNGISGKNIGFINTNRASLVVGKPKIEEERLAGFDVGNRNSKTLSLSGEIDANKRLDLLAPKVDINGTFKTTDAINVIAGRNQIDYKTLAVSALSGIQPHITLDGQILGSMQSGRIRLHNTDTDATQTLQGSFSADADLDATADNLKIVDSIIHSKDGDITLTGNQSLYVGGNINTQHIDADVTEENLADSVKLTNSSYQETQKFAGSQVAGDNIVLAGSDIQVEGSQLTGNTIAAAGDVVSIGGVVTTDSSSSTARNSKGLWFNENEALTKEQHNHQSSLTAKDSVNVAADSILAVAGTAIKGHEVTLTSGNDLIATTETTENSSSNINRYARETADLKTGSRTLTDAQQTGYQTVITGDKVSLDSNGEQRLEGVQIDAKTATLNSTKDLNVVNSSVSNRQTDEEDFKYWGGIGGGETHINNKTQTSLIGANINADTVSLSSDAAINITASKVAATNDTNIAATGDLNINHGFANNQDVVENRHGTAFNITDQKQVTDREAKTTVSSSISANNVALTGKNIEVAGSQIVATNNIDANAQDTLSTDIANATDITKTESYDLTRESTSNIDVDFSGGLAGIQDSVKIDASGSLKGVNTITTKGSGSAQGNSFTANNATISGQDVHLKGSTITTGEDATISGNQVTIGAAEALTTVDSEVVKSTGPEAYIRGGITGVEVGLSIGTDQAITEHNEYKAVNSAIEAGHSVGLSANETLTNQGTQIKGAQVDLAANAIVNDAAYDRRVDRKVVAGGEVALQGFLVTTPLIGGAISLTGEGVGETTDVKTAHATGINATDTVNIAAINTAVDAGTAINAKQINISADNYTGSAAYNTEVTTTHSGKGDVDVSAGTNDLMNVNVAVSGSGEYQYLQTGTAKAIKGSLTADTVAINGGTSAVAAQDVTANNYTLSGAKEARIGQNEDKQWKTLGGAELGGSVGLSINTVAAAAGAVVPLPSVSGNAGFDYLGVEDSQAQVANVNANELTITGGELAQIDGANIMSDTVEVKGAQANILAAQDTHRAVGVSMGGNAAFSADLLAGAASTNDLGAGAKLGVINETSNKAHGATIKTDNLTVTANDANSALVIEGANIEAKTVNLTNTGDVNVVAGESKDYVGNFGLGGNLSANADADSLDPHTVGAYLDVDSDDSRYYTLGAVNADTVTINSGNDVTLQSNINAGSLNTVVGKDFNITSAQDEIKKVDVTTKLAVDGSPIKFAQDVTSADIINALKDDFNNGTILGVSAASQTAVHVDHEKVTHQATVNADNFEATVGSQNIDVNAAKVSANNATLGGAIVTATNNDDFKHIVAVSANANTFSIPKFVKTIPSIIKDSVAGKPVDLPVNIDVTYDWDETDGANTKAEVTF